MVAFVRQILGILASQIEIERIFSIAKALTTFKRCQLQTDNMDKLIFIHKNWPFDPRVGCLKPFDLVVIYEAKYGLTNELDAKFVGEMECEEYANGDL
jgi:hypothetical protein